MLPCMWSDLYICRWAAIAARLPGRTDNDVKNYWNTHLRKHHQAMNVDPGATRVQSHLTRHMIQWESIRLETEERLSREAIHNRSKYYNPNSDRFFSLWNSEVGASFQRFQTGQALQTYQASTSSDTHSGVSGQVALPVSVKEEQQQGSYSESADDSGESTDSAMDMLLDSPIIE